MLSLCGLKTLRRGTEVKQRRDRRAPGVRSRERCLCGRAILSEAAIDILVSFPQRCLLDLAHCITRESLDEDDLFGRLEFGQAAAERRENSRFAQSRARTWNDGRCHGFAEIRMRGAANSGRRSTS